MDIRLRCGSCFDRRIRQESLVALLVDFGNPNDRRYAVRSRYTRSVGRLVRDWLAFLEKAGWLFENLICVKTTYTPAVNIPVPERVFTLTAAPVSEAAGPVSYAPRTTLNSLIAQCWKRSSVRFGAAVDVCPSPFNLPIVFPRAAAVI